MYLPLTPDMSFGMIHLYVTAKTAISFWLFSTVTHTGPGSRALIDLPTVRTSLPYTQRGPGSF